jgi:hypothetical protein
MLDPVTWSQEFYAAVWCAITSSAEGVLQAVITLIQSLIGLFT